MNISLLTAYSLTVLALIATPGPVVVLVTGAAAREGCASAVRTMIGGNLASLVLLAAAAAMLNGIVALDPRALTLMATIGSLFIIRLALGMLCAEPVTQDASKKRSGVMAGFATALSNPKDILFFAAFFPQFISVTDSFGLSLGLLTAVWVMIDLGVLTLYILAVRRWLTARYAQRLTTVSVFFLLILALYGLGYNLWQLSLQ
ncbi:TPA: LysE family transporter [Klebsiella oxytoca]|nr:LysE family transporter [Klebsiella oxytoca]HDX8808955.1 LysE family transporter [Klebsiella oxytoca]HEC2072649.1 LysE family transporter [Klebsiella oxytoca]HEJ9226954.1 LysE family transporter [Klebsiella oxytoca]HEJ9232133.1 LysE family transporter [Klebsiella oxytoca]